MICPDDLVGTAKLVKAVRLLRVVGAIHHQRHGDIGCLTGVTRSKDCGDECEYQSKSRYQHRRGHNSSQSMRHNNIG